MATMVSQCPPPPHLAPLARRERQHPHTAELAELAAALASPATMSPLGLDLEQLLQGLDASSGADTPHGECYSLAPPGPPGPGHAKWSDTELPKTPTSATISMWADAALALDVDADLDADVQQMQTEQSSDSKLPELPDIELFDLPDDAMAVDPKAVFAPPTPPMSSPEPESLGSRSSSVELRIVPGRGSGSSSDSESSGAETCSTHSEHMMATTSRVLTRTRGTAGSAGKKRAPLRRPANPRLRWKCSAEFLVNKIEPEERAKLARTRPDLYVPNVGDPMTKAQEKALRTALRKIRNVASAQRSRRSQKDYIAALEKRLAETEDENTKLSRANSSLSSSLNEALQQLARLRAAFAKPVGGSAALLMVAVCVGIAAPNVGSRLGDDGDLKDEVLGVTPAGFQSRVLLSTAAAPMDVTASATWGSIALGVACAAMLMLFAISMAYRRRVTGGLSVGARLEALADKLGSCGTIVQSYPASSNERFDADSAPGDDAVFVE